ncbi:MAG: DUF4340 domain-containing protein [Chloroflexi bacterium]|nr:DUF4340 domain-containing protein [Chloroflexota bacterium]
MKLRDTAILLVILALLGGYVYFFEWQGEGAAATPTPSAVTPLWDVEAANIVGLAVQGPQGAIRLHKEITTNAWQIQEPTQEPADNLRVHSTVDALAGLSASRALTDVTDLGTYGLAAPSWEVDITLLGGESLSLHVGDQNPAGSQYYVQREGDPAVYLVYRSSIESLQRLATEPPYQPTPTPTSPAATATAAP